MNKWHYPQDCLACYPGPSSNFKTNTSPPTTKPQQLHIYSDVPSLLLPWNLSRSSRAFQETVWKSAYNEYLTQLAPICFAAPQRNYFSCRSLSSSPRHTSNSSGLQAFSSRSVASTPASLGLPQYLLCKSFLAFFSSWVQWHARVHGRKNWGPIPTKHTYLLPFVSLTKVTRKSRRCRRRR